MSKAVKSIKKAVKKVGKQVEKGAKSVGKRLEGAAKGDLSDLASVVSVGLTDVAKGQLKLGEKALGALQPQLPALPDVPTAEDIAGQINIDIPEPQTQGAVQGAIGTAAPSIDLGATEGSRRRSGAALGRRKLRVPLGGLR